MSTDQIDRRVVKANSNVSDETETLSKLLAARYSCRRFRSESVPRSEIELILSIAQNAASWCNSQPWEVIVTEGEGTERLRKKLYAAALGDAESQSVKMAPDFAFPDAYTGIYKERQREVGWQLYESVGIEFGDRVGSGKQMLENFRFFGAPHAMIITSERMLGHYGALDCGLYISVLLLAAQSQGIGIIPQAAVAGYAPIIREHFDLPNNRAIVLGCSFGYPLEEDPINRFRSRRAKLSDVVTWST